MIQVSIAKKKVTTDNGTIIYLHQNNALDLEFTREAFGYEAEHKGWFREGDRLYILDEAIDIQEAISELQRDAPPSILDETLPKLGIEESERELFQMDDGAVVKWIRHPSALPEICQPHWRDHQLFIEINNPRLSYVAYHSIHRLAVLEGGDNIPRYFAPGGLRWIDYESKEAAISDALDMSLAVSMKIQVTGTPCAGSKVSIFGDYRKKPEVLGSIGAAMERLGLNISAADLGLSTKDMQTYILPAAPTFTVPIGVYKGGTGAAMITYLGVFEGLRGMAGSLSGSPKVGDITVSMQGLGEVGVGLARLLIAEGTKLIIAEINPVTITQFKKEFPTSFESGQVQFLEDPDLIFDSKADIFCPCALRDILNDDNLNRLLKAGVKMVGGPANNLFPDQIKGPWIYHNAGLIVVPYEGIRAGGTAGVAHSIMTGIFGKCPFEPQEKVDRIGRYVQKIIDLSQSYDLPPQVISDRILFRRVKRRTIVTQETAFDIMEILASALSSKNLKLEKTIVDEYTKTGFFYGKGCFPNGGWKYLQ